jgi:hypothetical protein
MAALAVLVEAALMAMPSAAQEPADQPGLTAFSSERELRDFMRRLAAEQRREMEAVQNETDMAMPMPPPPPPPPPAAGAPAAPQLSITNNQIQGVDEGDIVKVRGDILVILRRGRLFSVSLANGGLRPVSHIDAFPPGVDGSGDWYDEMLIAGDRVVVIGYSYRRGGSQVNRFRLDPQGRLSFEDSYQLRSNDYYSSRNYASRLIGNRLILYSPLQLGFGDGDVLDALPAMRQWQPGRDGGMWKRTASAGSVYIPYVIRHGEGANINTLHSVTDCDLAAPVLDCHSTVVLGNASRTFFVSNNAVYLWVGDVWKRDRGADAFVYRIPFDGRPSAVAARGAPVDQFSFLPDAQRNALHVVVRAEGEGDAMWRPELSFGDVALLSIPMASFGSGSREVPLDRYQALPKPGGNAWEFHNRFVADHLLYAGGSDGQAGTVTVVPLASRQVRQLAVGHGIDRIDAIGPDAILVGTAGDSLGFTAVQLSAGPPRLGAEFRLAGAREGETRSHAFFFRPAPGSADGASGILGLPVARTIDGPRGAIPSAAMLFLTRRGGRLAEAGQLSAATGAGSDSDDGCQASCVDWYGNARPIFIGDRLFALLGYELVEGREREGRIGELGRTSFSPPAGRRRN